MLRAMKVLKFSPGNSNSTIPRHFFCLFCHYEMKIMGRRGRGGDSGMKLNLSTGNQRINAG